MGNMLYDPEAKRITGLLDFDMTAATHPCHEFFSSFEDVHGTTRDQGRSEKLRQAIITGDFSASGDVSEEEHAEIWEIAKAWDEAVKTCGGLRPSDLGGMKTLEKLNCFIDLLFPYYLGSDFIVNKKTAEENAKAREDVEKAINETLSEWGI